MFNLSSIGARALTSSLVIAVSGSVCSAETTYIFGFAPGAGSDNRREFINSVGEVALQAEPGDRLILIDALLQEPVAELRVPQARTIKARKRLLKPKFASMFRYFDNFSIEDGADELSINTPRFLDLIASSYIDEEGSDTRVFIYGSPYQTNPTDTRFTFTPGFVPSDGHFTLTENQSDFGTLGRNTLNGATIDWCYVEDGYDSQEINAVERFWVLYTQQLDGELNSFEPSAATIVRNISKSPNGPSMNVSVKRRDRAIAIRNVRQPLPEKAPDINSFTLGIAIDASASMDYAMPIVDRQLRIIVESLAKTDGSMKVAIQPFRGQLLKPLPITVLKPPHEDGGESLAVVSQYLASLTTKSEAVDVEQPLRELMEVIDLDADPSEHQFILCLGNAGFEEKTAPINELSDNERAYRGALIADLTDWSQQYVGREVHGVYFGDRTQIGFEFFDQLSAISGHRADTDFSAPARRIIEKAAADNTQN